MILWSDIPRVVLRKFFHGSMLNVDSLEKKNTKKEKKSKPSDL